jgi:hypothetical protein
MAKMYPNNQTLEIFGEQVQWPGVGADGKFTNGSFEDPMVKPSFIPAETINLILDNLSAFIEKCGSEPDSVNPNQLAGIATHLAQAQRLMRRDAEGRAKVAAPAALDDIARLQEIIDAVELITPYGHGMAREGRNLMEVLGVSTPLDAMAALHARLNNSDSAAVGQPNFYGLQIGDYIDGIDLIAGSVNTPWNNAYKNNRIVISGFNIYKGAGDTENTKNHILFTFRNCPMTQQMNATDTNTGGYNASAMKTFLEGDFKAALAAALGDCIYPVRRATSKKGGSEWSTFTVFLPTEVEIFGMQIYGDECDYWGTQIQMPIFAQSYEYRIKRYNGSRQWWWQSTPYKANPSNYC